MGAGPIGLFHLQLALWVRAGTVIISEPSDPHRDFAAELGAHLVVDTTSEDLSSVVGKVTGGIGVDSVVICISIPQLVNETFNRTRRGSLQHLRRSVRQGLLGRVEANLIHDNELEVTSTTDSRRADYETALRFIKSGGIDVTQMVTHRFSLRSVTHALDKSASGEGIKGGNNAVRATTTACAFNYLEGEMLEDALDRKSIALEAEADTWQAAVELCGKLLVSAGTVEERYVPAMVRMVEELGPYVVIAPGVAIPHARPEDGVEKGGVSLAVLREPVEFGSEENDPVDILFGFATPDKDSHVDAIQTLVEFIQHSENLEALRKAQSVDEIFEALKSGS